MVRRMEAEYTQHALKRMAQRGISRREVEAVLAEPLIDRPSKDNPGCRIVTGRPDGRKVEVVVVKDSKPPRVVSVWDS